MTESKLAREITSCLRTTALVGHHCGVHHGHASLSPQAVGRNGAIVQRSSPIVALWKKYRHKVSSEIEFTNLRIRVRVDVPCPSRSLSFANPQSFYFPVTLSSSPHHYLPSSTTFLTFPSPSCTPFTPTKFVHLSILSSPLRILHM